MYSLYSLIIFLLLSYKAPAQFVSQLSFYSPLISTFDMKYSNNHLVVSQNGLLIFDVTNPNNKPQLVAQKTYPGSVAYAVSVQNNYAYMAFGNNGLLAVYDISNFNNPVLKGSVAIPATAFYIYGDVEAHGNYVYLSGFDSLYTVNVSDPLQPFVVNIIPVQHTAFNGAEDIVIEGNYLYVKTSFSVEVYNITNPETPLLVSSIPYLHAYNKQLAADSIHHRIFLSWATVLQDFTGYDVYDVSNTSAPAFLYSDSTTFSSGDFGVLAYSYFDNVLYASRGGSINVFDVSEAHHFVTNFSGEDVPNASVSIQVKDSVFYNAKGGGLEVLKYSNTPAFVCTAPDGLKQKVIDTNAGLYWNKKPGSVWYLVRYRVIGTNDWKYVPSKNNIAQLSNLIPGKAYTWEVKSFCGLSRKASSDWSLYNVFYVKSNNVIIAVSPNPATDKINVQVNDLAVSLFIISDLTGRPLLKANATGKNTFISISTLTAGTYTVKALGKNGDLIAEKIIVKN